MRKCRCASVQARRAHDGVMMHMRGASKERYAAYKKRYARARCYIADAAKERKELCDAICSRYELLSAILPRSMFIILITHAHPCEIQRKTARRENVYMLFIRGVRSRS